MPTSSSKHAPGRTRLWPWTDPDAGFVRTVLALLPAAAGRAARAFPLRGAKGKGRL